MQPGINNFLIGSHRAGGQRARMISSGSFYGNPTADQYASMVKPNEICSAILKSGVLNKYFNMPYNSSTDYVGDSTHKELIEMLSFQKHTTAEDLKFAQKAEDDVTDVWIEALRILDLPEIEKQELRFFIDSTDGVLYLLKYFYQRPRPFQAAFVYNIKYYPLLKTDASSPSYPGGHAFDAYNVAFLLSKRHPEASVQLLDIAEKITRSRVHAGFHFPSDAIISKMLARELSDMGFFDNYLQYTK